MLVDDLPDAFTSGALEVAEPSKAGKFASGGCAVLMAAAADGFLYDTCRFSGRAGGRPFRRLFILLAPGLRNLPDDMGMGMRDPLRDLVDVVFPSNNSIPT